MSSIDLGQLGSAGFAIIGAPGELAGVSVSGAGDVNGDGISDLILGAMGASSTGAYSGRAYVVFGKTGGFGTIDLANFSAADGIVIEGAAARDYAGFSVSGGGDVNGDGFADLIVGAYSSDTAGMDAGSAYVVFGGSAPDSTIDLGALDPDQGFAMHGGADDDYAGRSVAFAGDIDGDGYDDLLIGAHYGSVAGYGAGQAYVVYGKAGGFGTLDLGSPDPADGFILTGAAGADRAGFSVAGAGDMNGDGYDDIIVGAPYAYGVGGAAYVLFGHSGSFGPIDLGTLGRYAGFAMIGQSWVYEAGNAVASAGDFNGDGFDDVVVGAPTSGYGAGYTYGAAFLVYGKADGFGPVDLSDLNAADGFEIYGDDPDGAVGFSVSGAGDVNGDGIEDIILGAPGSNFTYGGAYLIYGTAEGHDSIDLRALLPSQGFMIRGDDYLDVAGASVSGAGDINGDGFDDILVGAPYGRLGGTYSGQAYVIFGAGPTGAVTRIGTVIGQTIHGGAGDDLLEGRDGDDMLIGDDGDDEMLGGAGKDRIEGGHGDDWLRGGSGDDLIDGGGGSDRLSGGSGHDFLRARGGDSEMDGGSGNDRLIGGMSGDLMSGGEGNDYLDGVGGPDLMSGGSGDDVYRIRSSGDAALERAGEGFDRVVASASFTLGAGSHVEALTAATIPAAAIDLTGNELDNRIIGNDGANGLTGQAGDDNLTGGGGNDVLTGGEGLDRMSGGTGADRFVFESVSDGGLAAARDMIFDFDQGVDRIDLSAIDADPATRSDDAFAYVGEQGFSGTGAAEVRVEQLDRGVLVEVDVDGNGAADFQITLTNAVLPLATDFLL